MDKNSQKEALQKIALRNGCLYLPETDINGEISAPSAALTECLARHGYTLSEDALHSVNALTEQDVAAIVNAIEAVFGTQLNWSSLIKDWQKPTGETWTDHRLGYFANMFPKGAVDGIELPCGHVIPEGLFDLSRYNGCPLCGKPFVYKAGANTGGSTQKKILGRMTDADMRRLMLSIMAAPTPPSATEVDSLATIADIFGIPEDAGFGNIETRIMLSAKIFDKGQFSKALALLDGPVLLMRMLWYRQTGALRIVKKFGNPAYKLHFTRTQCKAVALWLDTVVSDAAARCEEMNPDRGMWVRFIRALRLPEYSRRLQLTSLQTLLDIFYRQAYATWAGETEAAAANGDTDRLLELLCERPGIFARRLFSTMLLAGNNKTLKAFASVADRVAPRLICSLAGAAPLWFSDSRRSVALAGGRRIEIEANRGIANLSADSLAASAEAVRQMAHEYFAARYAAKGVMVEKIYISPELMEIPMPVGDRGITVSDNAAALQGQMFPVEGDKVRLFLQWGEGLPAQHLDMDLSAAIIYKDGTKEDCAYYNLYPTGAVHSGDIQYIPDMVGAAEYIELDLPALAAAGAQYVVFSCNAYSVEELSPNLRVGWMSSEYPMKVADDTGVAYDPATVQHIVHISSNPSRGLVFGVLNVESRSITWLEMPNTTQTLGQLDIRGVEALLLKLRSKVTIGSLLRIYAAARSMTVTDDREAAEKIYDIRWASDTSAVAALLL